MDLNILETKEESFCHLYNFKTGEPLITEEGGKIGFGVACEDSDLFKKTQAKIYKKYSRNGKKKIDADKIPSMEVEQIASIITSVENVTYGDVVVGHNMDDLITFFKKFGWAKKQVGDHLDELSNFL